jgi:hypothetical protein
MTLPQRPLTKMSLEGMSRDGGGAFAMRQYSPKFSRIFRGSRRPVTTRARQNLPGNGCARLFPYDRPHVTIAALDAARWKSFGSRYYYGARSPARKSCRRSRSLPFLFLYFFILFALLCRRLFFCLFFMRGLVAARPQFPLKTLCESAFLSLGSIAKVQRCAI